MKPVVINIGVPNFKSLKTKVANWVVKNTDIVLSPKNPYMQRFFSTGFGADADIELTEPLKQHAVFYACVIIKARNIARIPLEMFLSGSDKPIDSDKAPINVLFNKVNPYITKNQMLQYCVIGLDVWGEAFIVKDRETYKGLPLYLWPQLPTNMKEQFNGTNFVGWKLSVNGRETFLLPEEVIHIKYFNPWNMYRGLAPQKVLELGLYNDWSAIKYNKRFFDNDGTPGAVFSTDQVLTDADYERLKQELLESRRGINHAHRAILLDGGMKLSTPAAMLKDMQFLEGRKYNRDEIIMVLGVPKEALQIYEDINYATAQVADVSLWEKTLIPEMELIEESFNANMLNELGFTCKYKRNAIEALNEKILLKVDAASKLWQIGVPFNILNERLNLGFPSIPGGDEPKQQGFDLSSFTDNRGSSNEPGKSIKDRFPTLANDTRLHQVDDVLLSKAARTNAWKKKLRVISPITNKCTSDVKGYFFSIQQKILKKLTKHVNLFESKSIEDDIGNLNEFFSDEKLGDILREAVDDALRVSFKNRNYPTPQTKLIVNEHLNKVSGINETAKSVLKEKLQEAVEEALREGYSEAQRTDAIYSAVKESMDISTRRAKTIGRTEVHGAFNQGLWEGTKETQPKFKMWLTSRDENVRDLHADLDGEKVAWDEAFSNGLMYPMDPSGSAEEVINCRCTYIDIYE